MSCLTEVALMFPDCNEDENDRNKKQPNIWYNRVYLCRLNRKMGSSNLPASFTPICGFLCHKFAPTTVFDLKDYKGGFVVPICKWVPQSFDKWVLAYKLKKKR